MLLNLPIAYYTTWFRPQLWGFFMLDFERGFSFCWFAKVFGLILAVAWLLQQLRVRYSLALFGGMWTLLALQWWLSSPTMLPEMIASWAICIGCAIQLFTQRKPWRLATAFAALIYFGANFILCCYPPAQIPLVYLMLAIVIGCVLERRQLGEFCAAKRGTLLLVGAIAVIALVLLRCWIDIRKGHRT